MSYFDDASLVMIPSGYKDQKVYSVKPIDGSGDLTFSRASNATRVNSSGLVEKVRTNNVLDSQDFTSGWTNGNVTISTSATANPVDGQLTAQDIIPNTSLSVHRILRTAGFANSINTWSIYAKAKGYDFITLVENGNTGANVSFNLSTGAVSQQNSAAGQIQSLGGGWYRCSMIVACGNTPRFDVYVSPTDSLAAYSGDGTSGVILFGAQAEQSDFGPTPYIATTSAAVSVGPVSGLPRLDYSGGASCPSLLLEPQRTNLVRFSEQFDNSAWLKLAAASISANQTTSPDGYTNADNITWTASGASTQLYQVNSTSGTSQTLSLFIKYISGSGTGFRLSVGSDIQFGINLEFSNGGATLTGTAGVNVTSYKIEDYGNNWFRVSVVAAYSAASTEYNLYRYSGTGTDVYAIWGAQLESASAIYATSYIPTLSSAVTRVNERVLKTGIGSLIGGTSGTIFYEIHTNPNMSTQFYKQLFYYIDASALQGYAFVDNSYFIKTNANLGNMTSSIALAKDTTYKIAIAYALNDFKLYINGVEAASSTSGTPKDFVDILSIGSYAGVGEYNEFGFKQILHFKTRLSNASLSELTTL